MAASIDKHDHSTDYNGEFGSWTSHDHCGRGSNGHKVDQVYPAVNGGQNGRCKGNLNSHFRETSPLKEKRKKNKKKRSKANREEEREERDATEASARYDRNNSIDMNKSLEQDLDMPREDLASPLMPISGPKELKIMPQPYQFGFLLVICFIGMKSNLLFKSNIALWDRSLTDPRTQRGEDSPTDPAKNLSPTSSRNNPGNIDDWGSKNTGNGNRRMGIFHRIFGKHNAKHQAKLETKILKQNTIQPTFSEMAKKSSPLTVEKTGWHHPLRHLLEGASAFSHVMETKRQFESHEEKDELNTKENGSFADGYRSHLASHKEENDAKNDEVDWKKWKYAMSNDFYLSDEEIGLVQDLSERVIIRARNEKRELERNGFFSSIGEGISPDLNDNSNSANRGADITGNVVGSPSGGLNPKAILNFHDRVDQVPWGGTTNEYTKWWPKAAPDNSRDIHNNSDAKNGGKDGKSRNRKVISSQSEGGRLLAAYLKIMKWPQDLHTKFPFKLCVNGCGSETAILHTLEWREKYKPWCMSPDSIQFNQNGFLYHRGHSRAGPGQKEESSDAEYLSNAGHAMVWYRPGSLSYCKDPEMYNRVFINTLERAVSDSLLRNRGEIGRFNAVLDCHNVGLRSIPGISHIKKGFTLLQDHFPDRLGVLLVVNLSGAAQIIMKMVLPFVTEEVRAKIHIVPNDPRERWEMFNQFIDEYQVPKWLGGKDEYLFDSREYYHGEDKCILDEEGIRDYLKSMPYHA